MKKIAILGTVGIPATYGGFETLAENLARYHHQHALPIQLTVYCSGPAYSNHPAEYLGAQLHYIPLKANGVASILYDMLSLLAAIRQHTEVILLLGVSGALALPLVRCCSRAKIITNIDGLEWKRAKWSRLASGFLKLSERLAVRYSHVVVADNAGIAEHVTQAYGRSCQVIAYGGDHTLSEPARPYTEAELPTQYALALCRIEPENNIAMILDAFASQTTMPLVFVGNWKHSEYGRDLYQRFSTLPNIHLLESIYDVGILRSLRSQATLYVHGHSAGGTNPSLVEMMHFGIPVLAFDCIYNRYSTDGKAAFFDSTAQLKQLLNQLPALDTHAMGNALKQIAQQRYTWDSVGESYFQLLLDQDTLTI